MKAFFNWSGGKDSALALYYAQKSGDYTIERLLTNINGKHRRISMHGVREELLEQQAEAINIPLQKIILPEQPSMQQYEETVEQNIQQLKQEGFTHSIFGDIFLEDLRKYREEQSTALGITAVFPLWKRDTKELLREFIDLGFKTILVCIKSEVLPKEFVGRIIDKEFLKDLPKNVDACGENGEFHSFVYDGPVFSKPVNFKKGEIIYREYESPKANDCFTTPNPAMGFYFQELIPLNEEGVSNFE